MDRNEIHFTKHTHVSDWFSKNISPCACFKVPLLWVGRDEVAFAMIIPDYFEYPFYWKAATSVREVFGVGMDMLKV